MSNNDILNIAFFANQVPWAYKIISKMDETQKAIYSNSPLPEIVRSISRKQSIMRNIADNINLGMNKLNTLLKNNKDADHCMQTGKALIFEDIHLIYSVLMYMEAFISTMKSCKDFLAKYAVIFNRLIINNNHYIAADFFNELEVKGLRRDWIDNLDDIRNDIEHNYSAWISFNKIGDNYILTLSLPKSLNKHKAHKKYQKDSLDTEELNGMINNYNNYFEKAIELLLNIN
jgi:hypothetical protein